MSELLKIYPDNPHEKAISKVVETLKAGGIVIIPTDSIYAFACDLSQTKAMEKLAQLKGTKLAEANFSIVFDDLSMLSDYTRPIPTSVYKLLKRTLPGPYTFILNATNKIPKLFQHKKKTVGIRIPDNGVPRAIVEALGNPIAVSSIHDRDNVVEYTTDPELIHERYKNMVDITVYGGMGDNEPSTIIDCSRTEPVLIRQGKGPVEDL